MRHRYIRPKPSNRYEQKSLSFSSTFALQITCIIYYRYSCEQVSVQTTRTRSLPSSLFTPSSVDAAARPPLPLPTPLPQPPYHRSWADSHYYPHWYYVYRARRHQAAFCRSYN